MTCTCILTFCHFALCSIIRCLKPFCYTTVSDINRSSTLLASPGHNPAVFRRFHFVGSMILFDRPLILRYDIIHTTILLSRLPYHCAKPEVGTFFLTPVKPPSIIQQCSFACRTKLKFVPYSNATESSMLLYHSPVYLTNSNCQRY